MGLSEWKGYKKIDFTVGGRESFIICPESAAKGNPWVWRCEFFGAFDTVDMALLKAGWHLAYHRASDMYGCPESIEYFSEFQSQVHKNYGLAEKAVLFGFSRGGLYAVNYAAEYPERVLALYLDAPVLDIRTWPCSNINSCESVDCMNLYGLTPDNLKDFDNNPIDKTEVLVKAKIPVIIVAGGADKSVPYELNSLIFYNKYKSAGGKIEMIVKPECGHHPHSLDDPTPVVEFIESVM